MTKFNKPIIYLGLSALVIGILILFSPLELEENHPIRYLFGLLIVLGFGSLFIKDSLQLFSNPLEVIKKNWGWVIIIIVFLIVGVREYLGY